MHPEAMVLMAQLVKKVEPTLDTNNVHVLDVGSRVVEAGQQTHGWMFPDDRYTYTGLDIEPGTNVDIVVEPYNWKLPRQYGLIVSSQVFEHVEYPWLTMGEIEKALAPGGIAILIAPTTPYIHRYPVDCYRYLPDGWKALAKWAKLEVLDCGVQQAGYWNDSYCVVRKI